MASPVAPAELDLKPVGGVLAHRLRGAIPPALFPTPECHPEGSAWGGARGGTSVENPVISNRKPSAAPVFCTLPLVSAGESCPVPRRGHLTR